MPSTVDRGTLQRPLTAAARLLARASLCSALLLAQASAMAIAPVVDPAAAWGPEFLDAYWRLHPDNAIAVGYYSVAERLFVADAAGRARLQDFLQTALAQLDSLDAAALSTAQQTDRALLQNQLREELWALTEAQDWQWDPSGYNVADAFARLLNSPYAPLQQRLRAVSARLALVPAYYTAARANIHEPSREHTRLAIAQNRGGRDVFGAELEEQVSKSALTRSEKQQFARRLTAARAAIDGYVAWLEALERAPTTRWRSFRLGAKLYERKFAFEIATGASPRELYDQAAAEKARVTARMELLTDMLWPKYFPDVAAPAERLERIGTLIAKLSEQHAAPAAVVDKIRSTVQELEDWVARKDLLSLDLGKPLIVRATPAYEQGVASGGIDAPGPYDAAAPTYFNFTPLDQLSPERAESYLQEYNRWMLPVFVIHEAVPGHYVQIMYSNRSPSLIKSLFGNTAMVEGWAVYSERMMLESGYGDDTAEQWLIYYKWYLRAVCNTLLDYGVHVLGMEEAAARHLLMYEAFQTEEQAREKWHRAQVTSVQLTSYYAGYSAIEQLRERLKREYGPRFALKRFHEHFLSYGSAPVAVIAALLAQDGL